MVEEFKNNNLDNVNKKPENENQVDRFSQTTRLLDKELSDKKENILKVLEKGNLREIFENLVSSEDGELCIISLLESGNNEEEIKNAILANLPEGYAYNVSTDKVVKTEIKKSDDYRGATTLDQKTEQAVQVVEDSKMDIELSKQVMEYAKQYNDYLLNKYPELVLQVNENLQSVKERLENDGVLNQLRASGYDDNFINDYIKVQTTLQELKSNPISYEQSDISFFDKVVKNLENACNIADTNLSSFNKENFEQTKKELFHDEVGNRDLIEAKKNNMKSDFHEKTYDKIFPEMGEDDMFKEYGKFLDDNLKKYWDKYKDNYSGLNDEWHNLYEKKAKGETLTQEEEEFLKIKEEVKNIKESMDEEKKNMMEELCIISQIKGMYMCMGEGDNFDLNKSRGIRYDKEGAMILDGHVDGVAFSIRQDINNPEARLQTSQKFAKLNNGDVFSVGGKDNFVDSNFILPSQNEIFQVIAEAVQSDESLADFDNQSDYITNLQTNIMGKMEKKYENTKYVHHYMEGQVKGEKIADKTLGLIGKINPSIINDTTLMKNITQENNKSLYDFMKILKFNIDNSTNTEKDNLNQCITKILEITNYYADSNGVEDYVTLKYPPIIDNYLKNKVWLNGGDGNSRLNLLSNLFGYYSKKSEDTREGTEKGSTSKVMINDLYRDLFESNNGNNKSQTAVKRETEQKLNSYRKEAEDQSKKADQGLRLDDDNIWKR